LQGGDDAAIIEFIKYRGFRPPISEMTPGIKPELMLLM
jgi:hypothetical protein